MGGYGLLKAWQVLDSRRLFFGLKSSDLLGDVTRSIAWSFFKWIISKILKSLHSFGDRSWKILAPQLVLWLC